MAFAKRIKERVSRSTLWGGGEPPRRRVISPKISAATNRINRGDKKIFDFCLGGMLVRWAGNLNTLII